MEKADCEDCQFNLSSGCTQYGVHTDAVNEDKECRKFKSKEL